LANRGPTNLNGPDVPAIVDFLRVTLPQAYLGLDDLELAPSQIRDFVSTFAPDSGICLEMGVKGGRRGYTHHVQLLTPDGEACGDLCWGGERQSGTVSFELTGGGCARVAAARPFAQAWGHARATLETVQARITRLDIAHDDYEGKRTRDLARTMYESGEFDGQFARPAMNEQGWNDGSGKTLYIGKPTATRQLVVYDKGREQGAREGDSLVDWVRWEARFYGRNREVPLSALDAPWEYMVGEYPALSWISCVMHVVRVAVNRSAVNLAAAMRHCRRQYGGLLDLVLKHKGDEGSLPFIQRFLSRATVPAWVRSNPFGTSVLPAAFASPQLAI
jgi:DNA relaxase NicK